MSPPDRSPEGFEVGRAVALRHRPVPAALRRLRALVRDGVPAGAAAGLRDPRIPAGAWDSVLARELALTLSWAARRALAGAAPDAGALPGAAWSGDGTVVALLPRHGHAVHVIRRALPFALCGRPVRVHGHDVDRTVLRRCTATVAELLELPGLTAGDEPASAAVAGCGPDDLVVLTGRVATVAKVRAVTTARVLAATGDCVVLVGTDPARLRRTAEVLRGHDHPESCTRLGGVRVGDLHGPALDGSAADASAPPHPSAVYRLSGDLGEPPLAQHGYTCLPCDVDGVVGTLVGFARDPIGGWPGDFLV
ncbi:hypothetical protein [Plantactinospora sp. BC1]|uniref:hypothetical protein n=1 Tax=Plantactinospora sp. BC1 TaxID=2108470 RepID=UPI00131EF161|nr:hypothetical protein [Plantactinospora sp. BC1]